MFLYQLPAWNVGMRGLPHVMNSVLNKVNAKKNNFKINIRDVLCAIEYGIYPEFCSESEQNSGYILYLLV